MNKFKRILTATITAAMAIIITASMAACDSGTTAGGSATGTSDVEIQNFNYGFIEEENYVDGVTTATDTTRYTELCADTVYYMIINFDIGVRKNNDGQSMLNLLVGIDNVEELSGTIEEANSGNTNEMTFIDANTGERAKQTTVSFKIPADVNTLKNINMIMRLVPVTVGESHVNVEFEANDDEFLIYGECDGITKNLKIVAVTLETPVLEYDGSYYISWTHVKNADYYYIYVDSSLLKDDDGNAVYVLADEYVAVGDKITFTKLDDYIYNRHTVKVQACSYSTNYNASSYSNEVTVIIA